MDLISTRDLPKEFIEKTLSLARRFEPVARQKRRVNVLEGKSVASLFFEPSTRTQISFQAAISLTGGRRVGFSDPKTSSMMKGETFTDTIRVIDNYASCIVMRHPVDGAAARAAEVADSPVINAGDGSNQHPTQALLDLYTIKKEKGTLDGLTVTFLGDLKYGRTVHSLAYALSNYDGVTLEFCSPSSLRMPSFMLEELSKKVKVRETPMTPIDLSNADVVYSTRVQKERFPDDEDYAKSTYVLDPSLMRQVKQDAIVLHPLPRVEEIAKEVDDDPRAKYFAQAFNGVPVRMAVLSLILQGRDDFD